MKNELNFLFNTDRLFLENKLPNFKEKLPNVLFSSSEQVVYSHDSLEVIIDKVGTVLISTQLEKSAELRDKIPQIIDEYTKLTTIDKMFSQNKNFKIVAPKEKKFDVTSQLHSLNLNYTIADTEGSVTLAVTN